MNQRIVLVTSHNDLFNQPLWMILQLKLYIDDLFSFRPLTQISIGNFILDDYIAFHLIGGFECWYCHSTVISFHLISIYHLFQ